MVKKSLEKSPKMGKNNIFPFELNEILIIFLITKKNFRKQYFVFNISITRIGAEEFDHNVKIKFKDKI